MDMRERIMAAIDRADHHSVGFLPRAADAVLDVLREPDARMIEAVIHADMDIYWSYRADGRPGGPEDVWRHMIDAARKLQPRP